MAEKKRKIMKKRFLLSFALLLATFNIFGESIDEVIDRYESSYLNWITGDWDDDRTILSLQALNPLLEAQRDNREKFYWQSRILLAIGTIYFQDGKSDLSLAALEASRDLAERALEMDNFSEGWRIFSDAGSFIMLQKGVGYIIANSSKVQEDAEKALDLNPDNARASLIVAQGLVNAPRLFGGNKKKGLEVLESLLKRRDLDREDSYFIEMALGDAYETAGKEDMARKTFESVLNTYPRNGWAQKRLEDL